VIDIAPRIGGEHLQQSAEVAVRACGDELLGDQAMLGSGDVEAGTASGGGDLLPGPPGKLPAGRSGPVNNLGDGVEEHLEDVVHDEGDPLGRLSCCNTASKASRTPSANATRSAGSAALNSASVASNSISPETGVLSAGPRGSDLIQAQTAGHHDQPSPLILDPAGIGAHQTHERVLDDVFGGTDVPEHLEREVNQVRPVIPEHGRSSHRPAAPRLPR
jgi:hypothetical protein